MGALGSLCCQSCGTSEAHRIAIVLFVALFIRFVSETPEITFSKIVTKIVRQSTCMFQLPFFETNQAEELLIILKTQTVCLSFCSVLYLIV